MSSNGRSPNVPMTSGPPALRKSGASAISMRQARLSMRWLRDIATPVNSTSTTPLCASNRASARTRSRATGVPATGPENCDSRTASVRAGWTTALPCDQPTRLGAGSPFTLGWMVCSTQGGAFQPTAVGVLGTEPIHAAEDSVVVFYTDRTFATAHEAAAVEHRGNAGPLIRWRDRDRSRQVPCGSRADAECGQISEHSKWMSH